jgi:hypothetical protein
MYYHVVSYYFFLRDHDLSMDKAEADFTGMHERLHATPLITEDRIQSLAERLVSAMRNE